MAKEKANKTQQEQEASADVKQLEVALNEREKALDEKETALDEKESELRERESDLEIQEGVLKDKETDLGEKEQGLKDKEAELSEKESALNKREEALKALEDKSKTPKLPKKKKPVGFEFRGQKYQFSASAPEKIRIFGEVMSQKEIAKDEEVLVHLIGGNSSLIEKMYENGK